MSVPGSSLPRARAAAGALRSLVSLARRRIARGQTPSLADQGLWVPSGHFYSPIPDNDEIRRRAGSIFPDQTTALQVPGVDLRLDAQRALLDELAPLVAETRLHRTAAEAQAAGHRYFTDNHSYGSGDGQFLSLLLRHLRPVRLIELGGGHSTAATVDARERWLDGRLAITLVEPYPDLAQEVLTASDWASVELLRVGTQDVPLERFEALEAGDILFVDSTHVAKTGSDVNWIVFEILPRLASGVWIHVHDIFPRFEYPPDWVYEHRGWTEAYVLRAFLQFNQDFEIALWPTLLRALDPDDLLARFPGLVANGGGAIWLRRR